MWGDVSHIADSVAADGYRWESEKRWRAVSCAAAALRVAGQVTAKSFA